MKNINVVIFLLFALVLYSCHDIKKEDRPNVLWLTFEDTSPQFIGCYGDNYAHTPNIDKLASEGVRFTAAFSTGTVCSPSRFALITGCRTTRYSTGHHRSNYALPDNIEAFPKYLRDLGYYTSNNSKTDYNTSKHKHFIKTGWDESSNSAGWWNRKPGQPFFAVFNSFHSHQSRTMTNPYWKYKEQILDHLDSVDIIGQNDFKVPPLFNDTPEMRKELSRIYNSIQLSDQQFGEILERLEADGLKDSTIIFCFSDHGEGMPWGKTYPRALGYRVPFVIYFPDMYKHLSPWGTQVVTSDVVDFVDLPATVLSLVGIEVPDYMEGKALMGKYKTNSKTYTIGGLDRTGENTTLCRTISDGTYVLNKNFMPFQPEKRWQKYFDFSTISQNIRNDYKLGKLNKTQSGLLRKNGSCTFYNLNNDPWELIDLSDSLSFKSVVLEFEDYLKADLISKKDAHFIPEYSLKKSKRTPYDLSRDKQFFPAEDIISIAFQCGDEKALENHLNALSHPNDIVRYWAAIGVYSHYSLFGKHSLMKNINDQTYPPADIFIQATKFHGFGDEVSLNILLSYLAGDNPELATLTAQLLLLPQNIEQSLLVQIIHICAESEFAMVKQCGELFDNKYNQKPLSYNRFW